jgi:hypothetical protein
MKPIYDLDLSKAARDGLKNNGFETWLILALQKHHEVGEDIDMSTIPENELFLLHAFAITPCKNITMLTVPSLWYAHTSKPLIEELQECFPELKVRLREGNEGGTLVRIGGRAGDSVATPTDAADAAAPAPAAALIQSAGETFIQKPRCVKCKGMKKGCDRERPCARCVKAGLGFNDCVPEGEEFRIDGIFGSGKPVKGRSHGRNQNADADQNDVDINTTGTDGE